MSPLLCRANSASGKLPSLSDQLGVYSLEHDLSIIRAFFEPGIWKDFSKEHRALREEVETALADYCSGRIIDPIAVWGAFGAGKTQFLFWAAEKCVEHGRLPIYFHLNDLLDGLAENPSPDGFRDHARRFVARVVSELRSDPTSDFLRHLYRDDAFLAYVREQLAGIDTSADARPVLLIDEVEQAYITLRDTVRADDRSPLRAWLEDSAFKICAFAVGSLYVLGKADRERMRIRAIPAVRPSYAKTLLHDIPEPVVNSLWWLSRGKPRHLMKAAQRFRSMKPSGTIEIHEFVRELDSVSQAPYETDSQNVVPACYVDHFQTEEFPHLLAIQPLRGQGEGRLFPIADGLERELLTIVRDAFKMEAVAIDLVRYLMMLIEATSVEGHFALSEADTPYLVRLAVDFLLEYERERLEKETVEGGASLRKLLEAHDSAEQQSGQIFWKLQGKLNTTESAIPALSFSVMAAAFPLPTTSPTLIGTNPTEIRRRYEDSKQPVFSWRDAAQNAVVFLTSTSVLTDYSDTPEFRQYALSPTSGVVVLLPHDANEWRPSGLLEWLREHDRVRVVHLPLALTDFLLSLRDADKEGGDPFSIALRAEADKNLQRQVSFYRTRLVSFVSESTCRPKTTIPSDIPKRFTDILNRLADKDTVSLATRQAFESLSPQVNAYLVDLRDLVVDSKSVWGRSGLSSLADDLLPHRSPRSDRIESAKVIDDIRTSFSAHADALRRLATFVGEDEIEFLSADQSCKLALRSLWNTKRLGAEPPPTDLAPYNSQLTDIVAILGTARETETVLKRLGIVVSWGSVGVLLEVLPRLQKVAADLSALLQAPGGADRRLAIALFEQFLATLVDTVWAEVSKAKTSLSRVATSVRTLADSRARVLVAASSESARFANCDHPGLTSLLDNLQGQALQRTSGESSLEDAANALDDAAQDFESVEDGLARLESAFQQLSDWATGQ